MTVRFATRRFIGDYDPKEMIYRHSCYVDGELVNFEIMDTSASQDETSLELEDKCKWGESFVFVYDVTDKYSFLELTRLKFIASYTHSRMRGCNFRPCWALIGNKSDLADVERMVSTDDGAKLACELGCHIFREISVKEHADDARMVYEDLWREFAKTCPRSPSSSQRRKHSGRIQDKIQVLCSNASVHSCMNYPPPPTSIVSNLTSSIKRAASLSGSQLLHHALSSKDIFADDNNNASDFIHEHRLMYIPKIPEEERDFEDIDCCGRGRENSDVVDDVIENGDDDGDGTDDSEEVRYRKRGRRGATCATKYHSHSS